jgi:hypothetical protein
MALSKSFPTPTTQEAFRVVVRFAVGAPPLEFPVPVAPMAPEPFVPEVSTPAKLMIVIEEMTLCERVALTVILLSAEEENARQISEPPL